MKKKYLDYTATKVKSSSIQPIKGDLINYCNRLTLKRQRNYFERIRQTYRLSKSYALPLVIQMHIQSKVVTGQQLFFTNVYTLATNHTFGHIDVINFSFYATQLSM